MRKTALLVSLFLASVALAGLPGIILNPNSTYDFADCASGGSSSLNLPSGTYLLTVTDSDVFICFASTCAAGGRKFPQGTVMGIAIGSSGSDISCRSAASTGDVQFTLAM